MIKLHRLATADDVTQTAATMVCDLVRAKPDAAIGLATGRTQEPLFSELLRRYHAGRVSFGKVRFFHLDEYWGMPTASQYAMSGSLDRLLVDALDAPEHQFYRIDGTAKDPIVEAARYEAVIRRAGGIDLQVLGMGTNAHIAFNEPGSPHDSRTRLITLTEETREQSRGFFPPGADVPARALTMGIATILEAKSILVLVTGRSKIAALCETIEGPIAVQCPASALRLHPACIVLCDKEAAEGLTETGEPDS